MMTLGRQYLAEIYGCSAVKLNDIEFLRGAMLKAARLAEATVVSEVFHKFSPFGISGVVVIAESHLAIHCWPEHGCASIDLFTCSATMRADVALNFLRDAFQATRLDVKEVERARIPILETVL